MSVLSFLRSEASRAVLSDSELSSINTSIGTIQKRLNNYFGDTLKTHFLFGSYSRGTILPRSMDSHSDIDYMVVFEDGSYTPQTYLDRLRKFVEYYYSTSEIYQSSPTIVLELNHIKFELVPARESWLYGYEIPNGNGGWLGTNPYDFNEKLTNANKNHNYLIKPTIRLAKYWNASNGYIFNSFLFEKLITNLYFWSCSNQKDYFFAVINALDTSNVYSQKSKDKINKAKKIVQNVLEYEAEDMPYMAEEEIKKLFL